VLSFNTYVAIISRLSLRSQVEYIICLQFFVQSLVAISIISCLHDKVGLTSARRASTSSQLHRIDEAFI